MSTNIIITMNQTYATGNIGWKTDQFILSNENTLEGKQNEMQLENLLPFAFNREA